MLSQRRPFTLDRMVRLGFTVLVLWGLYWLAQALAPVLIPFGVAVLIAYILAPLVATLEARGLTRPWAVGTVLGGLSVLALGLGYLVLRAVVQESLRCAALLRAFAEENQVAARIQTWLPADLVEQLRNEAGSWRELVELVGQERVFTVVQKIAPVSLQLLDNLGGLLGLLVAASIIAIYVIFLLLDFDWFQRSWPKTLPPRWKPVVLAVLDEFSAAMRVHVRAQVLIASVLAVFMSIGFALVGLPMGVLFGLIVGACSVVPYLQLVTIPAAGFLGLLMVMEGSASLAWVIGGISAVYLLAQVLQDWVLGPRILGQAFGLKPAVILLALLAWGQLLGLLGLIIAIPTTCLLWAWYQRLIINPVPTLGAGLRRKQV